MPKATIREDDQVLGEVVRDEWAQLAEEVGAEIQSILAAGSRPESLTIAFDGCTWAEWEALPPETRQAIEEYGPC